MNPYTYEPCGCGEETITVASKVSFPLPPPAAEGTTRPQFQVKTLLLLLYVCSDAPVPLAATVSINTSSAIDTHMIINHRQYTTVLHDVYFYRRWYFRHSS